MDKGQCAFRNVPKINKLNRPKTWLVESGLRERVGMIKEDHK